MDDVAKALAGPCQDANCAVAVEHTAAECLAMRSTGCLVLPADRKARNKQPGFARNTEPPPVSPELAAAIAIVDRYEREREQLQRDLVALALEAAAGLTSDSTAPFHAGAHVAYAAAAKMCERVALRAAEQEG